MGEIYHVLFLDDMESRHKEFDRLRPDDARVTHVYTAAAAIKEIERLRPVQVFLDHDLSEQDIMCVVGEATTEPTGMTVVDHIMTMDDPPRNVVIHSCNGPARMEMCARLREHPAGIRVQEVPFPELMFRLSVASGR